MGLNTVAFWREAGKEMGILKDCSETDLSFCCRVMLSALSKWVLTTVGGVEQSVSIVRIQHVIEEKLASYLKVLPIESTITFDDVGEMIYKTLLENGAFYHVQYNVQPVSHKLIRCGKASLIRGLMPEEKACFSGFAPFALESAEKENLTDAFMLWSLGGNETIDLVWRRSIPVDGRVDIDEFLNIERISGKYYTNRKNPNWPFTMGRRRQTENLYNHDYYILIGTEVRRIPSDYQEASIHEYTRLAMMNKIKKQVVTASISEHIVQVEFSYLLPTPDLRFVRYISWPASISNMKDDFNFMLHPAVWPAIKERLISLGYEVHENHD